MLACFLPQVYAESEPIFSGQVPGAALLRTAKFPAAAGERTWAFIQDRGSGLLGWKPALLHVIERSVHAVKALQLPTFFCSGWVVFLLGVTWDDFLADSFQATILIHMFRLHSVLSRHHRILSIFCIDSILPSSKSQLSLHGQALVDIQGLPQVMLQITLGSKRIWYT